MMRRVWGGRALWTLGVILGTGTAGHGQGIAPGDLNPLMQHMAAEVNRLTDDVRMDFAQAPSGRYIVQDMNELGQAVNELAASVQANPDPYRLQQMVAGIDTSWQHLRNEIAQSGVNSPVVDRDMLRFSSEESQIVQKIGMNAYPQGYYNATAAPTGLTETQRLAHALVDRARALVAVIRADMVGGGGGRLLQDAANLDQTADAFHDAIDLNGTPDAARNGFAPVADMSDRIEQELAGIQTSPRIQSAWQSFLSVEVLLRQNLGLQNQPNQLAYSAIPQTGPSPVVALADQLATQAAQFVQVFSQTANAVPEGGAFLADSQRLQAAAANFRQDAAQGLNPSQLAFEFRDVDAIWQILARRTNRIARGRSGPNIQQVGLMGQTVAQIHQYLGMPGYAPGVGPFNPPR